MNQENLYVNIVDLHNYLFNILEHDLVPLISINEEEKRSTKYYNIE